MAPLAQAMAGVALSAKDCTVCGNIGTADLCPICADPARATGESRLASPDYKVEIIVIAAKA